MGQLALIPSQWFSLTTRLHEDAEAAANFRSFIRAGRRVADALVDKIDLLKPDVVLETNGQSFFESICFWICRDRSIDVVTLEQGFRDGTVILRRNDAASKLDHSLWWNRWSERALAEDEKRDIENLIADRKEGRTSDPYWHADVTSAAENSRFESLTVMFTNITWDTAVIGRELAFPSMQNWIEATIELFASRPTDGLVIRIHPAEVRLRQMKTREPVAEMISSTFPSLPQNVEVLLPEDPTSSYSLMERADLGLVYTSTTGLEMALCEVPVVVAGATHYGKRGFTVDVASPAEYRAAVTRLLDHPSERCTRVDLALKYAHLFFFAAPISFPYVRGVGGKLPGIDLTDISTLMPGGDPDVERICDGILGSGDFGPAS